MSRVAVGMFDYQYGSLGAGTGLVADSTAGIERGEPTGSGLGRPLARSEWRTFFGAGHRL